MPRIAREAFANEPLATDSTSGLLSAADKTKLDGIAAGATANSTAVVAPLTNSGSAANPVLGIAAATEGAAGSLSAADKTKLDGIAAGATLNPMTDTTSIILGVDLSLTTADTWYAGPSQALGAGTWLIWGAAVLRDNAGAATFSARIDTGPNGAQAVGSTGGAGQIVTLQVGPQVVAGGTTYTLSAYSSGAVSVMLRLNPQTNVIASYLRAVRVA